MAFTRSFLKGLLSARLIAFLAGFVIASCSHECAAAEADSKPPSASPSASAAPPDQQSCFQCDGGGRIPCRAVGCTSGMIECPGPCLKLSRGKWERWPQPVPGSNPNELYQKFPNGPGQWTGWSRQHIGEVIVVQNGKARNIGKCTQCRGKARVKCTTCDTKGTQTCELCEGKKTVPAAWAPTDNPWFNRQPDLIRLKDGRAFLGKVAMQTASKITIKTRDGKLIEVSPTDITSPAKLSR